jgi:hypothetical protein
MDRSSKSCLLRLIPHPVPLRIKSRLVQITPLVFHQSETWLGLATCMHAYFTNRRYPLSLHGFGIGIGIGIVQFGEQGARYLAGEMYVMIAQC